MISLFPKSICMKNLAVIIVEQNKCLPEKGFFPIIKTFGKAIIINCCKVSYRNKDRRIQDP